MLIKQRKRSSLSEAQLTDEKVYKSRRNIIKALGLASLSAPLSASAGLFDVFSSESEETEGFIDNRKALQAKSNPSYQPDIIKTPEEKVLTYNNFYEFGTDKGAPFKNAQNFRFEPWTLEIGGLVNKPFKMSYDDLLKSFPLEDRLYRFRCVEAWSMNIPWVGFPLAALIRKADPLGSARYVAFETLHDPEQMPGQKNPYVGGGIDYPYVEGLRLDEALNPLTLMSVGLYGKTLAPQNGAPIRLVVPWKYGFKSIKSIVKVHLLEAQPATTWNLLASHEYGFYANVNPEVDHPRWSQGSERFIGEGGLFSSRRKDTLLFNGYAEEVGDIYRGMDLKVHY
ncbi:protein-methionine-sulfoxide reductase catalytic subunit MsrP [Parasalinivibrio latis]|uniref:protein-methionine-sulfoxide reductase catalytic subunit MsrP n=1 Tax=Parasalinivibrio latis TaxID=2952610 RepID=UPI0030DFB8E1